MDDAQRIERLLTDDLRACAQVGSPTVCCKYLMRAADEIDRLRFDVVDMYERMLEQLARVVELEKLLGAICQQAAWLPMGNGAAIVEMCEHAISPTPAQPADRVKHVAGEESKS